MRGSHAKQLRGAAEAKTLGAPYASYRVLRGSGRIIDRIILSPDCTKAVMQRLKRAYKWSKRHGSAR